MHECSLCMESYHPSKRVVRFLPCGHDFCETCMKTLHVEGQIICPDCRTEHCVESVEICPIAYIAYKCQSAVDAEPQQEHQGRCHRMVNAMKEEQCASLLSVKFGVTEKSQILVKYRSSVKDISVHLDKLVDAFHAMVKLTQHAQRGLALETEKVANAATTGEEISREIDAKLLKLSAAITTQQIVEAVDQGDLQVEAAKDWISQCGLAYPDVSIIHQAAKVRNVFTKGLRGMLQCLQELKLPHAAETLSSLSAFMAWDDLVQEDVAQAAQGDLAQDDGGPQFALSQEDGVWDDLAQEDGAQGNITQHGASEADTAVTPGKVTVQSVRFPGARVEKLLIAGLVFAVYQHEGRPRYARITRHHNHLCLHHLHDNPPPTDAYTVPYSELVATMDAGSRLVFLDLAWPSSPPRRVTLRVKLDTPLATQFILIATGQQGPCYAYTRLGGVASLGNAKESIWGGDYDGRGGRSIVPELKEGQYENQPWTPGAVTGCGAKSATFAITTRHWPCESPAYQFGQVESGLEVVTDAVALGNDGVKNVTITDCGVVVPC